MSETPRALIVGSRGQDGRLLTESLRKSGYEVLGLHRQGVEAFGLNWSTALVSLEDPIAVRGLVEEFKPREIYYLAAYHHSSEARDGDEVEFFHRSFAVNTMGLVHFLDALRGAGPSCRLFYAASSHVFPAEGPSPQTEATPYSPENVYGISKVAGIHACRYYARKYGLFASSGIFYNHESPLRAANYVSKKICVAAAQIQRGRASELVLGDPDAQVDWGYAPDYVEAIRLILRHDEPTEFVIATGEAHRVGEFAQLVFAEAGLDAASYIRVNSGVLKAGRQTRVGDAAKLKRLTKWRPSVTFAEMAKRMARHELEKG